MHYVFSMAALRGSSGNAQLLFRGPLGEEGIFGPRGAARTPKQNGKDRKRAHAMSGYVQLAGRVFHDRDVDLSPRRTGRECVQRGWTGKRKQIWRSTLK
jgi:hypothetical protein